MSTRLQEDSSGARVMQGVERWVRRLPQKPKVWGNKDLHEAGGWQGRADSERRAPKSREEIDCSLQYEAVQWLLRETPRTHLLDVAGDHWERAKEREWDEEVEAEGADYTEFWRMFSLGDIFWKVRGRCQTIKKGVRRNWKGEYEELPSDRIMQHDNATWPSGVYPSKGRLFQHQKSM